MAPWRGTALADLSPILAVCICTGGRLVPLGRALLAARVEHDDCRVVRSVRAARGRLGWLRYPRNLGPPTDHHSRRLPGRKRGYPAAERASAFRVERVRPGDLGCGRTNCRACSSARSPSSSPGGSGREAASAFHVARATVAGERGEGWARGLPNACLLVAGDRRGAAVRRGSRFAPGWTGGVSSGPRRGAPAPTA
jgi:hypothetical protein